MIIETPFGKVAEKAKSRIIDDNDTSPRAETTWMVWGAESDYHAYQALNGIVPVTYAFAVSGQVGVLVNLAVKEVGERSNTDREYEAQAVYAVRPRADDIEYSFAIGGQSVQLTHSLGTLAYTGAGRIAPDFNGGIGVDPTGKVAGVSIERPRFTFAVTKHWLLSDVTTTYQLMLASMVGTVNATEYFGLAAGCVKLNGAQGSPDGKRWPVRYDFEYSAPEFNVQVADITIPYREGWQYIDIYRKNIDISVEKQIDVPHSVYLHNVYPKTNFHNLGLA